MKVVTTIEIYSLQKTEGLNHLSLNEGGHSMPTLRSQWMPSSGLNHLSLNEGGHRSVVSLEEQARNVSITFH